MTVASKTETRWIEAGHVVRAHGVYGAVRIALDVDTVNLLSQPQMLKLQRRGREHHNVHVVSTWKAIHRAFLVSFEPTLTREQAMAYGGAKLFVDPACLAPPEDNEYYFYELIGAKLIDVSGANVGTVTHIFDNQGQALIALRDGRGQEQLLPLVPDFCHTFDRDLRVLHVDVPEDLWM